MKRPGKTTQRILFIVIVAVVAVYQYFENPVPVTRNSTSEVRVQPADSVSNQWRAGEWVLVTGTVVRVLGDDNQGSRHQRFIIEFSGQRTLLVAHNIDLADRVPLAKGDTVTVRGQYEPNDRGGVIHWTHHDPQGGAGGWVEYRGGRYQ